MPAKQIAPLPSNFSVSVRISYDEKTGFKGTLQHKVVDVKDYKTDLDSDETNLILALVVRAAKGEVNFEPEPKNLLKDWKAALEKAKQQEEKDAGTLDKQEARISELESELTKARELHELEMQAAKRASENAVERIKELTNELKAERARTVPTEPPPASVEQPTDVIKEETPPETPAEAPVAKDVDENKSEEPNA